jgi:hypothetical protein
MQVVGDTQFSSLVKGEGKTDVLLPPGKTRVF